MISDHRVGVVLVKAVKEQIEAMDSLDEALMRASGRWGAGWTSSAMRFPDGQGPMNREFYRQIFGPRERG